MTENEKFKAYLKALKTPFTKICRLRFLQPDGSTAFALDNNPQNRRSHAFIADGSLSVNLQNGQRRTCTVTLCNIDSEFDFNVNNIWFGQEIALDEGVELPNGEDYYIPQGVFVIETPTETLNPTTKTVTYNLVDKWANLDGTLFGNLDGTYEVSIGTNIFEPITSLLALPRGNGQPVDSIPPIFTEYYNDKTQELPDGTTVSMAVTPYTLRVETNYADVILGLAKMLNAWVGYDATGALRLDPSQDDISDLTKPVLWQFSLNEAQLLGATYTVKNTEVYNDYIVIGEQLDDNTQPTGRATNYDPQSDTNVNLIGKKTLKTTEAGYGTVTQCQDYAAWKLKRSSVLQKSVSVSCSQIMHISENNLITIVRTDKPNSPTEKHLIQGFTRPLIGTGEMTIDATSVNDIVEATIT